VRGRIIASSAKEKKEKKERRNMRKQTKDLPESQSVWCVEG
jgi:hypothetical protein